MIRPTEKQELFIQSDVFEMFYGGARGGGKTFACLMDFAGVAQAHGRFAQGMLFRRSYKELEEAIKISKEMYRGRAKWRVGDKTWTFKNGATLSMRFLERDDDVEKYQGFSLTNIYFDELGNYPTSYPYLFMLSNLRSVEGVPAYIRATGNPGGVGAWWIKERFITGKEPNRIYYDEDGNGRMFIPARLEDNPRLMETDYAKRMKLLPPHLYKAFRLGDWDIFAGQVFEEWDQDRHVVDPFPMDPSWYRFASMDWGYAKPYAILFWAVTNEGRMVLFHEMYGGEKANEGSREQASDVAKQAHNMASFFGVEDMVADPAIWANQGFSEESVANIFSEYFIMHKGINDRINGCYRFHDYLKTNMMDGGPMLISFNTAKNFIRTIPTLTADKKKTEDVDTNTEDHAYDAARYGIMYMKDIGGNDVYTESRDEKVDLLRRHLGGQ